MARFFAKAFGGVDVEVSDEELGSLLAGQMFEEDESLTAEWWDHWVNLAASENHQDPSDDPDLFFNKTLPVSGTYTCR